MVNHQITIQICLSLITAISSLSAPKGPEFSASLRNTTVVVAGREARLPCAVDNLQEFKVAWVHYGDSGSAVLTVGTHVLTTNRRVSIMAERDSFTLIIANASVQDMGEYMCQISTVPPKKIYGKLKVLVPPQISVPPGDVTTNEGEDISLHCNATGDPEPKITWRREEGGQAFLNSSISEVDGGTLVLKSVKRKMAGAFLCVASNGVPPAVSARSLLLVNYGPVMEYDEPSSLMAFSGENITLQCNFRAYPRPNITWLYAKTKLSWDLTIYDNFSLIDRGSSTLYFQPVKPSHFGQYRCIVQNEFGSAASSVQLLEKITTTTSTTSSSTTTTNTHPTIPQSIGTSTMSTFDSPFSTSSRHLDTNARRGQNSEREAQRQGGSNWAISVPHDRNLSQLFPQEASKGETNPPNRYIQDSDQNFHHFSQSISEAGEVANSLIKRWILCLLTLREIWQRLSL